MVKVKVKMSYVIALLAAVPDAMLSVVCCTLPAVALAAAASFCCVASVKHVLSLFGRMLKL
jgi:hypothetical protein